MDKTDRDGIWASVLFWNAIDLMHAWQCCGTVRTNICYVVCRCEHYCGDHATPKANYWEMVSRAPFLMSTAHCPFMTAHALKSFIYQIQINQRRRRQYFEWNHIPFHLRKKVQSSKRSRDANSLLWSRVGEFIEDTNHAKRVNPIHVPFADS